MTYVAAHGLCRDPATEAAAAFIKALQKVIESAQREISLVRLLETHRVDGLILCSARLPDGALSKSLQAYKAAVLLKHILPSCEINASW